MNCEYIENNLDDICKASNTPTAEVEEHFTYCHQCEVKVAEHQHYLNVMSVFQTPELEVGKAAQLLAKAKTASKISEAEAKNDNHFSFFKGFAAASMMFVALFSSWQVYQQETPEPVQLVSAEGFSTDVTIVIYVPEDMPNADLQLSLPNNVQLAGLGDLSTISWPVNLKEGANTLSLPIDVASGVNLKESLRFIANIHYDNKEKKFEFNVNLSSPLNKPQHKVLMPVLPTTTPTV